MEAAKMACSLKKLGCKARGGLEVGGMQNCYSCPHSLHSSHYGLIAIWSAQNIFCVWGLGTRD